jgi:DedD protein
VPKVKERLTGAIILVALIVVLVPELLRGPIRSTSQTAAVASPNGEPPLRSYTIDLADEHPHGALSGSSAPLATGPLAAAAASPGTAAPPAAVPAAAAVTTTPSATPAAAASVAAASAAGTGATTTTAAAGHEPFVVQLGSFANRANAERLARQVQAQGFAVSVSRASSGRRLYQVRAGPAGDRAKAAQLAEQLRAHGHSGAIVPQ